MNKLRFFNQDKKSYAVILFLSVLFIDLFAAMFAFGGAQFIFHYSTLTDVSMFSTIESLILSTMLICASLLIIVYSYRNAHKNKLIALGCVNLILSLIPFVFNAAYYPFIYLIIEAITDLTNLSDSFHFSDWRLFISEFISVPFCICCFSLLRRLKRLNGARPETKMSFPMFSLITVSVFALVCVSAYYICNTPVSEDFNFSVFEYFM